MTLTAFVRDVVRKVGPTAPAAPNGHRRSVRVYALTCVVTLVSTWVGGALAVGPQDGRTDHAAPTSPEAQVGAMVREVARDLCDKQVVLLGESPTHGFGKAMQFKAALIRELVDGCRFKAVVFESGIYDFLNIRTLIETGGQVARDDVAAAIGGLWANRDVEPIVPFLLEKARSGDLVLGGIDDQIGRGTWAQRQMPAELVRHLAGDDRPRCLGVLQRHLLWQYTDDAPYGPNDKGSILGCLAQITRAIGQGPAADARRRTDHVQMIASLERSFARDFVQDVPGVDADTALFNARDRSMHENLRWLLSTLPAGSKVVVWTATTHAAKGLRGVPGLERRVPLGQLVRDDHGGRSFSVFVSAASGRYARTRQAPRELGPAPDGSLERRAFDGAGEARYYGLKELQGFGVIAGRALGTEFRMASWGELCDGLVVFREERPPDAPK